MDSTWFQEVLVRAGASQADLARHLHLAPSAVSRMINGERQMKLQEAVEIAAYLGLKQDEVLHHAGAEADHAAPASPPRRGRPRSSGTGTARALLAGRGGDTIPIRKAGHGAADEAPVGYTLRPGNLGGVRGAYAIYMVGDTMEPRYLQGWLLHANPYKPPSRGRDVIVYRKGEALVREFVGWKGTTLVLRQLNPPEDLRIPRAEVEECHLVVGVDQEG